MNIELKINKILTNNDIDEAINVLNLIHKWLVDYKLNNNAWRIEDAIKYKDPSEVVNQKHCFDCLKNFLNWTKEHRNLNSDQEKGLKILLEDISVGKYGKWFLGVFEDKMINN